MPLAYEVTRRVLSDGYRKRVAADIQTGVKTVEKWCVPPVALDGNGIPCPAQRFIDMQLALKRASHSDPFALLRHACRELGFLPPVRNEAVAESVSVDHVAKATREFGELLSAIATASADGVLSVADADRIYEEAAQLHAALAPILRQMQSVVVDGEESSIRERRGPQRVLPILLQLRRYA
jgi:hypothetical protein